MKHLKVGAPAARAAPSNGSLSSSASSSASPSASVGWVKQGGVERGGGCQPGAVGAEGEGVEQGVQAEGAGLSNRRQRAGVGAKGLSGEREGAMKSGGRREE
eukprot:CAMPEP_0184735252 /NCGR_PEP_ID=MMETSP0314-20130426/61793_1 /TAXON_ID=38298 /ORGANISM="Rhodella maculata, Strain CCMP 736" /LENGTH=101 /DNA_ID=CAMNT_0027202285 /DNA_START=176 /DNA_END=482 /DNA_ORIENTATION=-